MIVWHQLRVMGSASRGLNRLGKERPDRKRWARHGSTQWLWKRLGMSWKDRANPWRSFFLTDLP